MANEPWEHCMLERSSMLKLVEGELAEEGAQATVTYYGLNVFTDKLRRDQNTWEQAIAELGRKGWQMVNATYTDSDYGVNGRYLATILYFKRPAGVPERSPMLTNLNDV